MGIHSLEVGTTWVTPQDEVHIVVAQTKAAMIAEMKADGSRPSSLTTISDLLGPTELIAQIVSGGRPAILVFPELAFGSSDWAAIDALIRNSTKKLIVIAGFGFTSGENINSWKSAEGPTERKADWINVAAGRVYDLLP